VRSLGEWAARWVLQDPAQAELDPDLLVLWISRHVDFAPIVRAASTGRASL
jgi:hypothetical protein